MNEPEKPKKGWGWLQWGFIIVVSLIGISLIVPTIGFTASMANQTASANNARQIIMALKIWASENNGVFPDSKLPPPVSSNQVLRRLIQNEILEDEKIFGATNSPFVPDGNIGLSPDYSEACEPGENHWMLVAGLRSDTNGIYPVIFENALEPIWPPRWRFDSRLKPVRGRTWRQGTSILGRADNSVNVEKLVKKEGGLMLPDSYLKALEKESAPPITILDIEEKK